jgi:hypothetical protein
MSVSASPLSSQRQSVFSSQLHSSIRSSLCSSPLHLHLQGHSSVEALGHLTLLSSIFLALPKIRGKTLTTTTISSVYALLAKWFSVRDGGCLNGENSIRTGGMIRCVPAQSSQKYTNLRSGHLNTGFPVVIEVCLTPLSSVRSRPVDKILGREARCVEQYPYLASG